MALLQNIPVKDPDVNGTPGKDSGVTVSHLRVRFVGITFKRNGTLDHAECSVEGFVGNVAEKPLYLDSIPIALTPAQTATALALVQGRVNLHPTYVSAVPTADPA